MNKFNASEFIAAFIQTAKVFNQIVLMLVLSAVLARVVKGKPFASITVTDECSTEDHPFSAPKGK